MFLLRSAISQPPNRITRIASIQDVKTLVRWVAELSDGALKRAERVGDKFAIVIQMLLGTLGRISTSVPGTVARAVLL